jgi:Flp pilus assembly pilin Flp
MILPAHPNTNAAGLATGGALLLVWLLKSRFNVDLSIYYAGLIVGGAVSTVLFAGKRGLKGTLSALWNGTGTVWTGKPPPK